MDRDRLRACTSDDLISSAGKLAATMAATHSALLHILAVIDERELWRADGCCSLADWISFRLEVSRKNAHEWAEAARALGELPHLAEAFAEGRLSWDKTKAVAAMATPESDAALTADAGNIDTGRLELAARRARGVSAEEAQRRHRERFFALRRSPSLGGVRLSGFLPDVDGETVLKAISLLADDVPKDPETGLYPPIDQRCADALVDLASDHLVKEQEHLGERAFVVTHAELDGEGAITKAELEGGIVIAPETAERLLCDALVEPVVHPHGDQGASVARGVPADGVAATNGNVADPTLSNGTSTAGTSISGTRPLGSGRRSRRPSRRLRREVGRRDVWCRFPGCTRTRLGQTHHMQWWAHLGETEPECLSLLCRCHHRLMHEGGWSMRGDPYGVLEFIKPNGEVLESHLPELSDEVKDRIIGPALPDLGVSERVAQSELAAEPDRRVGSARGP